MKHLELHILQSFPVACLNRDDLNSPKTAIFGGVQRARVSASHGNGHAADIALFGRMVANDHSLTLEGAAMFGHALSTHKVDNEIEFFSAVDDLQPEEEAGAGMTGTLEYNSATYYRFSALNLDMLFNPNEKDEGKKGHLRSLSPDERCKVVRAFAEATLKAVPGARKNSMNAATLPGYVLGIVRSSSHPVQLVNAFEKPIKPNNGRSLFDASLEAFKAERERLNATWKLNEKELFTGAMPELNIDKFLSGVAEHVD